jgi:hypothetical protein
MSRIWRGPGTTNTWPRVAWMDMSLYGTEQHLVRLNAYIFILKGNLVYFMQNK